MIYYFKKQRRLMQIFILMQIFLLLMSTYSFASEKEQFVQKVPAHTWLFSNPKGITIDKEGYIYVADTNNHLIQKFTSDWTHVMTFGSNINGNGGNGNGEFHSPSDVAIDQEGYLYVVDTLNHRIQKFTSDGTHVMTFGSEGSEDGEFHSPNGIAIDKDGFIYVADRINHRIQKFASDGTHVMTFGGTGKGEGKFISPNDVSIDDNGYIYVVDQSNYRIQKFKSDGTYVMSFGSKGHNDGEFSNLEGITIDSKGNIYVTDEKRIQKFASDGTYVMTFGDNHSGDEALDYLAGIAVDRTGNIYVVDRNAGRIQKYQSNGTHVMTFGSKGSNDGKFNSPYGIAIDAENNIYVADKYNHRIQKFASDWTYIKTFGKEGTGEGEFNQPTDVAIDRQGYLYVADSYNHRIQKFTEDGEYIKSLPLKDKTGDKIGPKFISIDQNDFIYVAGSYRGYRYSPRIHKLKTDGTYVDYFDIGKFNTSNAAYGIAIGPEGFIYVADKYNHRIQKFTEDGTFVASWGSEGHEEGEFSYPCGVAVDHKGLIYVVDTWNDRIQRIDTKGTDDLSDDIFTIYESKNPGFNSPRGITVDAKNNVYVADTYNHIIQFLENIMPKVEQTIPSNNQKNILIDQEITIQFSEDIFITDQIDMMNITKNETVTHQVYQSDTDTIIIRPDKNLDFNTTYTVTVPKDAMKDPDYNPLEKDYTFSFTTRQAPDTANPYMVSTTPHHGEENVAIDTAIKMTFSEKILSKDLDLLKLKRETSVVNYVYQLDDKSLTITSTSNLDYNTEYTVTIPKGTVQDAVYNPSEQYTFNFSTVNNDANLDQLQISNGLFDPAFTSDTTAYNVNIGYSVSTITLTPTLKDDHASVQVNGVPVQNHTLSQPINLNVGKNEILLLVTAEDEKTTKTYTITITRARKKHSHSNNSSTSHSITDQKEDQTTITPNIIETLIEQEKPFTIKSDAIEVTFHKNVFNTQQIRDTFKNKELSIQLVEKQFTEKEKNQLLQKITKEGQKDFVKLYEKIFDVSANIITKDEKTTQKIDDFQGEIEMTIDLSDDVVTTDTIKNLTAIRYDIDQNGQINLVKVGGKYDQASKKFTFFTDQLGVFGIANAKEMTTIEITIGETISKVNGQDQINDVAPMILDNRTMVPVRFIAEDLGAKVSWDAQSKTVTINLDDKTFSMTIDQEIKNFDTPPMIIKNRTFVPLRYVSEQLGANVSWFPSSKTVYIVK